MTALYIRTTKEIKKKLKQQADKRGMTLNGLIMMIFDEWLKSGK